MIHYLIASCFVSFRFSRKGLSSKPCKQISLRLGMGVLCEMLEAIRLLRGLRSSENFFSLTGAIAADSGRRDVQCHAQTVGCVGLH